MFSKSISLLAASLTIGGALFCASCNISDSGAAVVDPTGTSNNTTNNGTNNTSTNNGTNNVATNNAVNCGNGTLDPGETCDGDCPTCDDSDPCTQDVVAGAAETCNIVCTTTAVTACVDGDMCCPEGCASDTDQDCACVPASCADAGKNCGTLPDGCGQMLICGSCPAQESCYANICQLSGGIGDSCQDATSCTQTGLCISNSGWPGGYCSAPCPNGDGDCPDGTHCEGSIDSCVQSCTDDSECNAGYACFDFSDAAGDPRKDGRTECLPVGSGIRPTGAPCANISDCTGGPGTQCIVAWPQGYCSSFCGVDADCDAGSHCDANGVADGGRCFKDCAADSDCRGAGYSCFDQDNDGRKECAPTRCPEGFSGPNCDQWDCSVPVIPASNQSPYCTAGFCKGTTGACLRLADNPNLSRASSNSACIPSTCCDSPQVTGTCNAGFCNDGNGCLFLQDHPQFARDSVTTACIAAECGLDCQEPGGGCNAGFCFDGNGSCLYLVNFPELQRGSGGQCLPAMCPVTF